jgi:histidine ammonia-lyase
MLCRINSLGRGVSAISPENFEKYIAVYNAGIVPCVPEQGSLGASGDLGPLAHIALVVTGAWRARYEGEVIPGEEALKRAGLKPARLSYKEGLAMINGTSMMVGVAVPVIYHTKRLLKQSALIAALSLEALRGKVMPYHPAWLSSMRNGEPQGMDQQIEDAYSLRAGAQILGPSVDAVWQAERRLPQCTFSWPVRQPGDGPCVHCVDDRL